MKACVCVLCKCVCVCVCVYLIDEKASLLIPCHKTNGPGSQNTFLTQKRNKAERMLYHMQCPARIFKYHNFTYILKKVICGLMDL